MSDAAVDGPQYRAPDAAAVPDAVARWAARTEPETMLLAAVRMLDPAALSASGRIDLLVALERAKACIDAQQQEVLAAIADLVRPAPPEFAGLDGPRAAADPALP